MLEKIFSMKTSNISYESPNLLPGVCKIFKINYLVSLSVDYNEKGRIITLANY